jgi:hypothetical protein
MGEELLRAFIEGKLKAINVQMIFLWLFLLFVLIQYSLLQNLQIFIPMIVPLSYHSGRVVFLLKNISNENEKEHKIKLWIKRRDLAT